MDELEAYFTPELIENAENFLTQQETEALASIVGELEKAAISAADLEETPYDESETLQQIACICFVAGRKYQDDLFAQEDVRGVIQIDAPTAGVLLNFMARLLQEEAQ